MKDSCLATSPAICFSLFRVRRAVATMVLCAATILGAGSLNLEAASSIQPNQIPAELARKGKGLSALKAVMAVATSYDHGKSRQDVKGFLLYRRPSDFRFQGLGPGGHPLFELILKANAFELYVPGDGKILKGAKDCFNRRFPDVAELETLIPLALLQWKDAHFEEALSHDARTTVIRVRMRQEMWKATLDSKDLHVLSLQRLNEGKPDLLAHFGDFGSGDYGWLPRRFDIQSSRAGWRSLVTIQQLEANPFLVESNFKLETLFSPQIEQCR
ncbi:MAG: hypothetical protein ACOYXY_19550 [Thermodesulfobacteriota bacterium]